MQQVFLLCFPNHLSWSLCTSYTVEIRHPGHLCIKTVHNNISHITEKAKITAVRSAIWTCESIIQLREISANNYLSQVETEITFSRLIFVSDVTDNFKPLSADCRFGHLQHILRLDIFPQQNCQQLRKSSESPSQFHLAPLLVLATLVVLPVLIQNLATNLFINIC